MKKLYNIITLALTSLFCFTACVSSSNPSGQIAVAGYTVSPAVVGAGVQTLASLGTKAEIKNDPSTKQYFQLAAVAIQALINSGNYDPTNLTAALDSIDNNDSVIADSTVGVVAIYQAFYGYTVDQAITNKSPYVIPVLNGLVNGINIGLGLPATLSTASTNIIIVPTNTLPVLTVLTNN